MPSFRTAPELDSSQPSAYNDLNRLDRHADRNSDRNPARLDRDDRRDGRDDRNSFDRNDLDRHAERERGEPNRRDSVPERVVERTVAAVERPVPGGFGNVQGQPLQTHPLQTHPLIEGLFSKLPQPETEWPLQSRQKWLQTAANIFDLMYIPNETEVGELAIRVERTPQR